MLPKGARGDEETLKTRVNDITILAIEPCFRSL
jgi:hypothetical protein